MTIAITAHTPAYAEYASALMASCAKHNVTVASSLIPDRGSWVKNCAQKPEAIRRALRTWDGPVLWLDADAEVCGSLDGLWRICAGADVGYHFRKRTREVLSGTVYVGKTERAETLLDDWVARCQADPNRWDQKHLQDAVLDAPELYVVDLPPAYCWINTMANEYPGTEPVVVHKQASRVMRAKVNKGAA